MGLRAEYKKKLMLEIEKRGYDLEKSKRLSRFVLLLMGLPPKRAKKFEEEITQLIPHKNMYATITQQDLNTVDHIAQFYYGNTFKEEREGRLQEKKERIAAQKIAEQERKERIQEQKRAEQEQKRAEQTVINLYHVTKMTVETIAEITSIEIEKIHQILKKSDK